jgi:hypothetical protein
VSHYLIVDQRIVDQPVAVVAEPSPAPSEALAAPRPLVRRILRWALNGWLVFHITAMIVAPATVGPTSDLLGSTWLIFQPYLQPLYLNHGHSFFAPEPGESSLLTFVAMKEDGTVIAKGRYPSKEDNKPRLLYHRYFMLTEHMSNRATDENRQLWHRSYALHLGRKYGAAKVSLSRIAHLLPSMEMGRNGVKLDDPASYEEQPLGIFRCDEP